MKMRSAGLAIALLATISSGAAAQDLGPLELNELVKSAEGWGGD